MTMRMGWRPPEMFCQRAFLVCTDLFLDQGSRQSLPSYTIEGNEWSSQAHWVPRPMRSSSPGLRRSSCIPSSSSGPNLDTASGIYYPNNYRARRTLPISQFLRTQERPPIAGLRALCPLCHLSWNAVSKASSNFSS